MVRRPRQAISEFEIREEPLPLHSWSEEDAQDPLAVVEDDIRRLIRELAEVRSAHSEKEREHKGGTTQLLLGAIDVLDAFGRVFANIHAKQAEVTPQMKIWIGNFRAVQRLLEKLLAEQGVTRIESLYQEFDPSWHRAVEALVDPSKPEGTIVEEAAPGYLWQGEILRKAEVVIAAAPETQRHRADRPG